MLYYTIISWWRLRYNRYLAVSFHFNNVGLIFSFIDITSYLIHDVMQRRIILFIYVIRTTARHSVYFTTVCVCINKACTYNLHIHSSTASNVYKLERVLS